MNGLWITLYLAAISIFFGTLLGVILSFMRRSKIKVINLLAQAFIGFIRGTPLLAQIYIVYVGFPTLFHFNIPDFLTGALALTLYSSAYISEIIRSGVDSVPFGQAEAARSLGMSSWKTMRDIILPQAVKNILPALVNQFIGNIKDSSLVSVLGVADMMYEAQVVRGSTAMGLQPILVVSLMYLVVTVVLSRILLILERRMKLSDQR
ncbi:amino acid ABC transporter permease [Liquorilactobacillus vini]|uniref:amino acid ABC transporter permease n=1 Tax=Liquorilactobacillus vini TaxID=238015 RepID=UPI0009D9AC2D|nr:amino acid ABC transporter permease [Liquorilactobacillus vini]